jgi:hypothetical protein
MERLLTVEFGPSRSKRFGRAVAEAQNGAGECNEVEPGRYRTSFLLGEDPAAYTGLARLLEHVRHWRATEVYEDDESVSAFHAREMGWCASFQLSSFRDCRERFNYGVLPRCAVCPLFDAERAIRAGFRDEPAPGQRVQIGFGQDDFGIGPEPDFTKITDLDFLFNPDLLAQLEGQIPDWMDLSGLVPDVPPEEWESPVRMNQRTERPSLAKTLLDWIGAWLNRRWR